MGKLKQTLQLINLKTKKVFKAPSITDLPNDNIPLFWWAKDSNFGDELNPYLIQEAFKKHCVLCSQRDIPHLIAIGSVLNFANKYSEVWGAGFLSPNTLFSELPNNIYAVRGKLSLEILRKIGYREPIALGDPALLLPNVFKPNVKKQYRIGLIPHFVDKMNPFVKSLSNRDELLVVDIQKPIEEVISQICSCEIIYSSSLHGIIVADAYGIEAHRIILSNKVVGGDFKFNDYSSAVGRPQGEKIVVSQDTTLKDLDRKRKNYTTKIKTDELLESFPIK